MANGGVRTFSSLPEFNIYIKQYEERTKTKYIVLKSDRAFGTSVAFANLNTSKDAAPAYPQHPGEVCDGLALDAFLRGLRPARLREQICITSSATRNEALVKVEELEAILDEETPAHRAVHAASGEQESGDDTATARAAAHRSNTSCTYCGRQGHFTRDCRRRIQREANRQTAGNENRLA
ncbi:hypothetical protein AAFF_G00295370 [Aldrovandia affinis]|uniref:CCHC-type domain-containing protein n=1 Tax=Aldrovandia affinis TaxID=143900 RepID=A0AAD7R944_9TELE|nr:hypothetical protein AAFF_G00295370 [Aldrovandia affinis]